MSDCRVEFPLDLDLAPLLVHRISGGTTKYSLIAVLDHHGTQASGHYSAQVRSHPGGGWLNCNDNSVTRAALARSPGAYLLWYVRQDTIPPRTPPRPPAQHDLQLCKRPRAKVRTGIKAKASTHSNTSARSRARAALAATHRASAIASARSTLPSPPRPSPPRRKVQSRATGVKTEASTSASACARSRGRVQVAAANEARATARAGFRTSGPPPSRVVTAAPRCYGAHRC